MFLLLPDTAASDAVVFVGGGCPGGVGGRRIGRGFFLHIGVGDGGGGFNASLLLMILILLPLLLLHFPFDASVVVGGGGRTHGGSGGDGGRSVCRGCSLNIGVGDGGGA